MGLFSALAEPNRRYILEALARDGELSATDISAKFRISPAAISQHLKVLREARLVQMERRAQQRIYQLNPEKITELEDWAKEIRLRWEDRFDKLEESLK